MFIVQSLIDMKIIIKVFLKPVKSLLIALNIDKYYYDYLIKKRSVEYKRFKRLYIKDSWKDKGRIKEEMCLMKRYWHYPPEYQYIRYKLYEKDIDKEELLDYIPPFFIYRRYNPRIYRNVDKRLFSDKLYLFNYFTKIGVKTPEVLLKVSGGGII